MGDLIGYIRLAESEQLGPYAGDLNQLEYPVTVNFRVPSPFYAKVYDLPELMHKSSSDFFKISNYSDDPSEYLAYTYLYNNAFNFMSYNTFSMNTRRYATFVDSVPFPKTISSSTSTLLFYTLFSSGISRYDDYYTVYSDVTFGCDTNPYDEGRFAQIAKIGNAMFIVYASTLFTIPDEKEFRFRRLYGWENAIIYPDTTGNILTIEPSRNVSNRPYSLDFVVKYNNVVVDNSEVSFTMYIYKDGTPIENSNLASIVDGHLEVSKLGPTQLYIKAEYGGQSAWSVCESPQFNDPYNPGGTSRPAGGGGSFGSGEVSDDISGQLPIGTSEGDTSDCGVFTRYLVDNSELLIIGKYLWNPGILQIIDQAVLSLFMPSIMDGVISLVSYPFDINSIPNLRFSTGRTPTIANFAFITNPAEAYQFEVLETSGAQFDWGTIDIQNFYGAFLDYEPYTKIELYLPWGTGFVPIDPNECTPGTLNVKTNFEFDKGTCVHTVTATNSRTGTTTVIGCYSGLCGKQIPISSLDYASKATAIVSLGVSAAVGAVAGPGTARAIAAESAGDKAIVSAYQSGGLMFSDEARSVKTEAMNKTIAKYESVTKKAAKMATNSAIQAAHSKVNISRNGSFTNGSNGLGMQHPYIIISRPNQSVPVEYGHFYGYPSNIYESLRNLSGYTEVGEIHLKGISCTSNEYSEIESLLKDGVVF